MKKLTQEEFINKAKLIHGDKYDYSLVEYKNARTNIKIFCWKHGEFEQNPEKHTKKGHGCPLCSKNIKLNNNEFITKAKLVHRDKYDYSFIEYTNSESKVTIICPIHGKFNQKATNHLSGNGCPHCKASKGELKVKKFLDDNKLEFIPQKTFDECKNKKLLPFDFYLPNYNMVIEYQGEQHFKSINCWGGEEGLIKTQLTDRLKKEYCNLKGIKLLEISYKDKNNIYEILQKHLELPQGA